LFVSHALATHATIFTSTTIFRSIMETLDNGKSINDTVNGDVPDTISCIRFHAEAIDKLQDDITPSSDDGLNIVVREPIGVVAAIDRKSTRRNSSHVSISYAVSGV